jgi:hypothetical protein
VQWHGSSSTDQTVHGAEAKKKKMASPVKWSLAKQGLINVTVFNSALEMFFSGKSFLIKMISSAVNLSLLAHEPKYQSCHNIKKNNS